MTKDEHRNSTALAEGTPGSFTLLAATPFDANRAATGVQYQSRQLVTLNDFDGAGSASNKTTVYPAYTL